MEDSIPFVSLTDFKDEELKMMETASNLLKLAICSEKEDDIRRSYIAKQYMNALETKKNKKDKPPLPFNLNLKPRTYRRPRSTPIDMRTLLPYLPQMRKSSQDSQELGFSSSSSHSSRLGNIQVSQELGSSTSSSQSSMLDNTQVSQELGSSSCSSQSSKKLKLTIRLKPRAAQPELPLDFKKKIAELGGSDPELVFVKSLFAGDVDSSKSRLTLPYRQCRVDLGDVKNKPVKVIYRPDDDVREMMMNLNKWDTVSSYVFNGSWNELVNFNALKVKDVVQVWRFRVKDEMSFALVKL